MKILVLEDDENRIAKFRRELVGHNVDVSTTSADAIARLQANHYELAFFDHDLGGTTMAPSDGEDDTGYKVAKYLYKSDISQCPKHIIVHSLNMHGAENIRGLLNHAVCIPFIRLDIAGAADRIANFINRHENGQEGR